MGMTSKNIIITDAVKVWEEYTLDLKRLNANLYTTDIIQKNLDKLNKKVGIAGSIIDVTNEAAIIRNKLNLGLIHS